MGLWKKFVFLFVFAQYVSRSYIFDFDVCSAKSLLKSRVEGSSTKFGKKIGAEGETNDLLPFNLFVVLLFLTKSIDVGFTTSIAFRFLH